MDDELRTNPLIPDRTKSELAVSQRGPISAESRPLVYLLSRQGETEVCVPYLFQKALLARSDGWTSRLFRRWGLEKCLDELSVRGKGAIIRRYITGDQIGFAKWGDMLDYGAPHNEVHRFDLCKWQLATLHTGRSFRLHSWYKTQSCVNLSRTCT